MNPYALQGTKMSALKNLTDNLALNSKLSSLKNSTFVISIPERMNTEATSRTQAGLIAMNEEIKIIIQNYIHL